MFSMRSTNVPIISIVLLCLIIIFSEIGLAADTNPDKPVIFPQIGHSNDAHSIFTTITKDGRYVISAANDGIILWDVKSRREIKRYGLKDIRKVAVTDNGKFILSGGDSGMNLIDLYSGNIKNTYKFKVDSLFLKPIITPDSKSVIFNDDQGNINLVDLITGKLIRKIIFKKLKEVENYKLTPNGKYIIGIDNSNKPLISIIDISNGKEVRTINTSASRITDFTISSDSSQLYISTDNDEVKIINTNNGKEKYLYKVKTTGDEIGKVELLCSPNNNHLLQVITYKTDISHEATLSNNRDKYTVVVFDILSNQIIRNETKAGILEDPVITPDNKSILVGLGLIDLLTGKDINAFDAETNFISNIYQSKNKLYTSHSISTDSFIFELSSGTLINRLKETEFLIANDNVFTFKHEKNDASFNLINTTNNTKLILDKFTHGWSTHKISNDGHNFIVEGVNNNLEALFAIDINNGKLKSILYEGRETTHDIAFTPDNKYVVVSYKSYSGGEILKLHELETGRLVRTFIDSRETLGDKRGQGAFNTIAITPDGNKVFAYNVNGTLKVYDINTGRLIKKIDNIYDISKLSMFPDGKGLLLGKSSGDIDIMDLVTGKIVAGYYGHCGTISSIAHYNDKLLTGSKDGTVRLWDKSGKEIIQFITFADGEWVSITPDGYYNSSPNGDKHLNVRIGNNVYGIENYREAFFRPDLVKIALSGGSLKGYRNIADVKQPPQVEIVDTPLTVAGDELTVKLKLTDIGGGIGDVRLYLNASAIMLDNTRGLKVADKGIFRNYKIRLTKGDNTIRAVAFNAENTMQSNPVEHTVTSTFTSSTKPTLHALVIGVNEFNNPKLKLQYAVPDADLFTETLKNGASDLFGKVNIVRLTTPEQTTSEYIASELKKMRSINPDDMFILFVASHGTVDDGEYFLITSNVGSTSTARLKSDALSQEKIKELIANIPATKKVIVLDTCNAGQMGDALQVAMLTRGMSEDTAFKILSRAVGSTILSSATSTQEALEGYQGHGLFTWVLAEGMKGKADKGKTGFIKTTDLVDYVESEVPDIAEKHFKRKQYPTTAVSGQGFPIGKSGQ